MICWALSRESSLSCFRQIQYLKRGFPTKQCIFLVYTPHCSLVTHRLAPHFRWWYPLAFFKLRKQKLGSRAKPNDWNCSSLAARKSGYTLRWSGNWCSYGPWVSDGQCMPPVPPGPYWLSRKFGKVRATWDLWRMNTRLLLSTGGQ